MEQIVWSTEGVPERERFDFWREASRAAFGIRIEPNPAATVPFRGRIDAWSAAGVHGYRMRSDAFEVLRSRSEIARRPWEACMIFREAGAGTHFDFSGREVVSPPGDLVIADADLL